MNERAEGAHFWQCEVAACEEFGSGDRLVRRRGALPPCPTRVVAVVASDRLVRFRDVALTRHFENEVLAALITRGLITDDDVAQILAQEHTGFGAWVGEPFDEPDRTRFVARYIERGPVSLEKLTIQDDIITYTTKDERVHEFDAMEFLALLSCHIPKPYESITVSVLSCTGSTR